MTLRAAALAAALLLLPAVWGWVVPRLLVRVWPARPAADVQEGRPLPDYEI